VINEQSQQREAQDRQNKLREKEEIIPFLKNNDCMVNCPGRGAHALRPYKNAYIISCRLLRKWYNSIFSILGNGNSQQLEKNDNSNLIWRDIGLRGINFTNAILPGIELEGTNLDTVRFSRAHLLGAVFKETYLDSTIVVDWVGYSFILYEARC